MLLQNTQKWNDTLSKPKAQVTVRSDSNNKPSERQEEGEGAMGDEEEEDPMGEKRARQEQADERKGSLDSAKIMAEESRRKPVISEKTLQLQEKELKARIATQEEQIMWQDLTASDNTARRYYELKQQQILRALEKEMEDVENDVC
jgi:hypothetical protein